MIYLTASFSPPFTENNTHVCCMAAFPFSFWLFLFLLTYCTPSFFPVFFISSSVLFNTDEWGQSLCPEITKADSFTSLQHQYHTALSTRSHQRRAQMHYTASRINSTSKLWSITSVSHPFHPSPFPALNTCLFCFFHYFWSSRSWQQYSYFSRFISALKIIKVYFTFLHVWFIFDFSVFPCFPLDFNSIFLI